MKRNILVAINIVAACLSTVACSGKDIIVKVQDLPAITQTFINTHFTNTSVSYAIKDGNEYEIRLENGWELDFDKKGQWEQIDCKRDEVPSSIISLLPESIQSYISSNFKNASVKGVSKDHSGYDIELSNGLDLEFTKNGQFRKIDD